MFQAVEPIGQVLDRAAAGARMTSAEGVRLYREAPMRRLSQVAQALRSRRVPRPLVTYLIDRNINYSNVCITDCLFCSFYRPLGHAESYVRTKGELAQKLCELVAAGGTRVLMQGGHHPELRIGWYEDLLRWMRAEFPSIEINAFSPSEVDHLATLENLDCEVVLRRLQAAGLAGLPGGGAEILDDEMRKQVAWKKLSTAGWLRVMDVAQRIGLATSASMVIGFGETVQHRVNHLMHLREQQERALREYGNGFSAFITWTMVLDHPPLGKVLRRKQMRKAGAHPYLRHLAICRILLDNFEHIQASWPTMGPEIAQASLHFGADDFGSTMMEENVVSAAGNPRGSMTEAELQACIRAEGFVPAQRDTRYHILKVCAEPSVAAPVVG